jgi:hypothetical protein
MCGCHDLPLRIMATARPDSWAGINTLAVCMAVMLWNVEFVVFFEIIIAAKPADYVRRS